MDIEKIDYLIELYNLLLPEGVLSLEDKERLLGFMNRFFGSRPASESQGGLENRPLYSEINLEYQDGYYDIRDDGTWLITPDTATNWLESRDLISFQRDYQFLRKCIDRFCVEGSSSQFSISDLNWLKEKVGLIRYTTSYMDWLDEVSEDLIPPENDKPTFTLGLDKSSPLSDRIVALANSGLIEIINNDYEFRRCAASDCDDIFYPRKNQKYHSEECRERTKRVKDRESKAENRIADYQKMARWLTQLPLETELDATKIATKINEIANRRPGPGYTGHQIGRLLGIEELKIELERLGVTYERRPTGRQYVCTFRKT